MSFKAEASPRRFVAAALQLLRSDASKAQVYRIDGLRELPVDVETVLRKPGNYVLRSREELADSDEESWVDVTTAVVTDEDDQATAKSNASAKGEAAKDEGWTLLVQNLHRSLEKKDVRIEELEKKLEKAAAREKSLTEDLAEAAAENESGAGRWVALVEKVLPHAIGALQGSRFRDELAQRVAALRLDPQKRDELLALLNREEMRGPSTVTIDTEAG